MELPIFNDNLKSSGSWTSRLARELDLYREWRNSRTGPPGGADSYLWAGTDGERLAEALASVAGWATGDGSFDRERLMEVNRILRGGEAPGELLRIAPPPLLSELHDPAPASMLPRLLDLAFDWFTTEGFGELHPLEQATLVYLRLLDLSPFAAENDLTALVAAGFYTSRGGLPVLILSPMERDEAELKQFTQALEAAFRMLTQPLVEYFAEALIRTMQREREGTV